MTLATTTDDGDMLAELRKGSRAAKAAFFDRHCQSVRRVLLRLLGHDADLADLLNEVFTRALESLRRYRGDAGGLGPWITRIAVHTARETIRRRQRGRRHLATARDVDAAPHPGASPDIELALKRAYAALDQMHPDLRIPFALRFVDGMELTEVADACDVSLATVKRRLVKARARFVLLARRDAVLAGWLEGEAT